MNRKFTIGLGTFIALCLTGFLVFRYLNPKTVPRFAASDLPDTYMKNANYNEYDDRGRLQKRLVSAYVLHYPQHNISHLKQPRFIFITNKEEEWHIDSDAGIMQGDADRIDLKGHVTMRRLPKPRNPEITILTSGATLHPSLSFAETTATVLIRQSCSEITARGMQADFKKGVIKLLSHSRGVYQTPCPH